MQNLVFSCLPWRETAGGGTPKLNMASCIHTIRGMERIILEYAMVACPQKPKNDKIS